MWNPSKFFKKIVKKKHVKRSQNFVMSNGEAICIIFLMATKLLENLNYQLKNKIVSCT